METQAYFDNIRWQRFSLKLTYTKQSQKRIHLLEKTLVAQDDLIVELEG